MKPENYVEHVLTSLSHQPREDLQAHLNRLNEILNRIEGVPSPEKESLLVELILAPTERTTEAESFHSSP